MVFRRKSRSWRNLPSATSVSRSALVAEKTRTSTRRVFDEPTRSNSPVSSVRSSLACRPCEMLAISSRNSVPPSAISKRPTRSLLASVNAPFTWPNSSLSKTPSASPPVFTVHQRARGAQRDGVQRLRDQSLAGAVFAGDEDVGVGRADARDHVEHRAHGRRLRDQLRKALGAQRAILRLQALPLAQRAAEFDLRLENGGEARVVPGLLDEIARAAAHGLDGQLHAAPRGHHDHRAAWYRASGCD